MFSQKRKKLSTVDVLTLNFVAKVTIHPLIMCSSSSFFGTFFKYSYGFDDLSMHTDLELELDLSRSPPWSMLLEGCDVGSTFTADFGATLSSGTSSGMSTLLKKSSSSSKFKNSELDVLTFVELFDDYFSV